MNLKTRIFGSTYKFNSVKEVLAKANEEKSGDILAGVAATSGAERVAAKKVLSELTLEDLRSNPVVPYEEDEVTRIIEDNVNEPIYKEIKNLTVGEFREKILSHETTCSDIRRMSRGLTSEMVAAVTKLMSNMDLVYGAKKIRVTAKCNTTIGTERCLAVRLQPNHPTDDVEGMLASLREGLSYGIGDAVIGINPVDDSVESVKRLLDATHNFMREWEIPTQNCILAHITTQMKAVEQGAPSDLIFQSIAGSEKGNKAFGVNNSILKEAREIALKQGTGTGPNVMYFETGQGSELSSDAHHGADQLVMEARCYGLAKQFDPFLVNTVVGFIGPEYLYDSKQVIRAGLEDHFMGKLTGIPMGVDACYTNHMKADQNDIENLALLLTAAGCNYFMGIPMGDDVMLNYQCTSYHDIASLRTIMNLRPLTEFEKWMEKMGLMENGRLTSIAGDASIFTR
ncbi:ethanolamine ammonia-lyase subunit EutB [Clostridium sp. PL3]|uniref:Ethanolamine ammonia-lyase large subunit n=1 Tax=Clostridium thailandense TaxID=2794346 RepID=A0A949TS85_9CLOT|nr:ethanolamine ammonia-lyase subunit EutB [Clostridium thailandense]MBV7271328.1 ethanolamine ammonia-lyase subunit EutB [Clostridium thailandense]